MFINIVFRESNNFNNQKATETSIGTQIETNTLRNFLISNSPEYIQVVSDHWLKQEGPKRGVQVSVSLVFLVICLTGNCCQILVMIAYSRYVSLFAIELKILKICLT